MVMFPTGLFMGAASAILFSTFQIIRKVVCHVIRLTYSAFLVSLLKNMTAFLLFGCTRGNQ